MLEIKQPLVNTQQFNRTAHEQVGEPYPDGKEVVDGVQRREGRLRCAFKDAPSLRLRRCTGLRHGGLGRRLGLKS